MIELKMNESVRLHVTVLPSKSYYLDDGNGMFARPDLLRVEFEMNAAGVFTRQHRIGGDMPFKCETGKLRIYEYKPDRFLMKEVEENGNFSDEHSKILILTEPALCYVDGSRCVIGDGWVDKDDRSPLDDLGYWCSRLNLVYYRATWELRGSWNFESPFKPALWMTKLNVVNWMVRNAIQRLLDHVRDEVIEYVNVRNEGHFHDTVERVKDKLRREGRKRDAEIKRIGQQLQQKLEQRELKSTVKK